MRSQKGFTMIELLVVTILVSALVYIAVPRLRSSTDFNIKSASRSLTGTIKYLYNEAAFKKNIYRLVFDIDRDEYWVEVLVNNEYLISTEHLHQRRRLPSGVHFQGILTERNAARNSTLGQEPDYILFLPTGYVEPAAIHLQSENGDNYTLQTKPYTGGTRVYDEYVNVLDGGQLVPYYR